MNSAMTESPRLLYEPLSSAHVAGLFEAVEFWAATTPQNRRSIALLRRLGYVQIDDPPPPLLSYDPGDLIFALR